MFQLLNEETGDVHRPEKKRISIGSSDSCDIVVVHDDVSPTQVFLTKTKLGYFLMNFHPDHVVTVNDEPVKEKMLKHGDRFHLGDVTFVVQKAEEGEAALPAEEEAAPGEAMPETPSAEEPPPAEEPAPEAPAPTEEPPETAPPAEAPAGDDSPAPAETDAATLASPTIEDVTPDAPAPEEPVAPVAGTPPAEMAPWDVPVDDIEEGGVPKPLSPEEAEAMFGPGEAPPSEAPPAGEEPEPVSLDEVEDMFASEKKRMDVPQEMEKPKFRIHVASRNQEDRTFEVTGELTVGREDTNDIVLMARTVSRNHARFYLEGDALHVEDLQSAMGTKVNGAKTEKSVLRPGDIILIGDSTITVEGADVPAEPTAPDAPALPDRTPGAPVRTKVAVTPMLMIMGGNLDGKLFPVATKLTIGSAEGCEIRLESDGVSDVHAEVEESDGKIRIRDVSKGEGIRVNGAVVEDEEVSKGDAIEISDILLLVRETVTRVPVDDKGTEKIGAEEKDAGAEPPPAGEPAETVPEPADAGPAPPPETPAIGISALPLDDEKPAGGWPPPAVEKAAFSLVIVGGIMDGKTFPVSSEVTVGREGDNTIVLLDSTVSRRHARFQPSPEGVKVEDLKSATGVFVNEQRVSDRALEHGDTVRIGNTRMVLKELARALPQAPPDKAAGAAAPTGRAVKVPPDGKVSPDGPSLLTLRGAEKGVQYEMTKRIGFGRLDENDVVISHAESSGKHAELVLESGDRWVLRDLGSTNGTFLNGTKIEEAYVYHGDIIEVAYNEFRFRAPGRPTPPSGRKTPSLIIRTKGAVKERRQKLALEVHIGRDKRNLICIDNPLVSGDHARVFAEGRNYFVEDLGSTNGTWVKGQKISRKVLLQHGDSIFVGESVMTFKEPDKALRAGEPMKKSTMAALGGVVLVCAILVAVVILFRDKILPGPAKTGNGGAKVQNLLDQNAGFEEAAHGSPFLMWKASDAADFEVTDGTYYKGKYCLLMGKTADRYERSVALVYDKTFPVNPDGTAYRVSGFFKSEDVDAMGLSGFRLRWLDENGRPVCPDSYSHFLMTPTTGFDELKTSFRPPPKPPGVTALNVEVAVFSMGLTGKVLVDNISFEEVKWIDLPSSEQAQIMQWTYVESQEFRLRSNERGVFNVIRKGDDLPSLRRGGIVLEKASGIRNHQRLCDLEIGYPRQDKDSYIVSGTIRDLEGESFPRFRQELRPMPDGAHVEVVYYIESLTTGSISFQFSAGKPNASVTLYDRGGTKWDFQGAFPRKNNVQEIVVSTGERILSILFLTVCAVEARDDGKGLAFRAFPSLGASASKRLQVQFYTEPMQEKSQVLEWGERIRKEHDAGRKGMEYGLLVEGIGRFPKFAEKVRQWEQRAGEIRSEAERRIENLKATWDDYKGQIPHLGKEAVLKKISELMNVANKIAEDYTGSDLADPVKNILNEMSRERGKLEIKDLTALCDKLLGPAEKFFEEGKVLKARVYINTLEATGKVDLFPPDLQERYDKIKRKIKEFCDAKATDLAELQALAEQYEKANEVGMALKIWKKIAQKFVDDPDNPYGTSADALRAHQKIRELGG
jgi:pSer/pThr/pTyr-binding forkhead associated (FHA) protein